MKMTFRWYGPNDSIPLSYIRQIPGMTGVVTAVYARARVEQRIHRRHAQNVCGQRA